MTNNKVGVLIWPSPILGIVETFLGFLFVEA